MEQPDRREAGGRVPLGSSGSEGHEHREGPAESNAVAGDPTEEVAVGEEEPEGTGGNAGALDELRRRSEAKDRHIRELYDELAAVRLAVDEARARTEAGELRVGGLEEERAQLKERLRTFEEEERGRRRRRERQDRRVARLEREIERREDEIRRLRDLLDEKEREMEAHDREAQDTVSRKEAALQNALRRIAGLQRDLEEREHETAELRATLAELDLAHENHRRMAEPANRLRAGIDLFNDSEHLETVDSISESLGQPEVHVSLDEGGDESWVILTFTWGDVTWRAYVANPSLGAREPRVYQMSAGEDLSGVHREPSNAHIGPDGRVILGL